MLKHVEYSCLYRSTWGTVTGARLKWSSSRPPQSAYYRAHAARYTNSASHTHHSVFICLCICALRRPVYYSTDFYAARVSRGRENRRGGPDVERNQRSQTKINSCGHSSLDCSLMALTGHGKHVLWTRLPT